MRKFRFTLVSLAAAALLNLLVISIWCSSPRPDSPPRKDAGRTVYLAGPALQSRAVPPREADLVTPPRTSDRPAIDVFILGPTVIERGTDVVATVVATRSTGPGDAVPAGGVPVAFALNDKGASIVSTTGVTGPDGCLEVRLAVPADAPATAQLVARTTGESIVTVTCPSHVVDRADSNRVLLVTDKPVYQPGQVLHLRALALDSSSLHPASGEVVFEVEDSKGNKVFRKRCDLGDHGVASADFQLADEVLMGDYRISAKNGTAAGEKHVGVRKYVLPKFKVAVAPERNWYLPRETVKGTIRSDYFFGKPVANAEVTIKAESFASSARGFFSGTVRTDEKGEAKFEVELPAYFAGAALDQGEPRVNLAVTVKDPAGHEESSTVSLSMANKAIRLVALPESGKLVAGVENTVFVVATTPDGAPVACEVEMDVAGKTLKGNADATGIAELRYTPDSLVPISIPVKARIATGPWCTETVTLQSEQGIDRMLLRLDKSLAKAGDRVGVEAFATFGAGRVFVEAIRDGRAVFATSCDMRDGRATAEIALPPSEFGAMEVHAWAILGNGEVVGDTRVMHVDPGNDLKIEMTPDRASWRPGESATIDFHVTGPDGADAAAALGVVVVDSSVYAVQDLQPGLEKVYFTLARELQKPSPGSRIPGSMSSLVTNSGPDASAQRIACVLLSAATTPSRVASGNSAGNRREALLRKQALVWRTLAQWILTWKEPWFVRDGAGGTPRWQPHLLRRIAADARVKVGDTLFTDPWGNEITMEALEKVNPAFTIDWWAATTSKCLLPEAWKQLVALGAKGELFREGFLVKDPVAKLKALGLPSDSLEDIFGRPIPLKTLLAQEPAFSRENLLAASENAQRTAIFARLAAHVAREGGVLWRYDGWRYDPEILRAAGLPEYTAAGNPLTVDDLASDKCGLSAENVVRAAQGERDIELVSSLAKFLELKSWEEAIAADGESWKPGLEKTLEDLTLLQPTNLLAPGGARWSLELACKTDPRVRPAALANRRFATSVAAIARSICRYIHNGTGRLEENSIEKLARAGNLEESVARDPWGNYYRTLPLAPRDAKSTPGCGLLDSQMKIVSAGPDRTFGTADDLRVDAPPPDTGDIIFLTPTPGRKAVPPALQQSPVPPEFALALTQLRGEVVDEGDEVIWFPDAEEADHNEAANLDAMKGDSVEFLSAMPGEGGGIRGREGLDRPRGTFSAMGVGGGGGAGGRHGEPFGGGRRNVRAGGSAGPERPSGIHMREWFPETLLWNPLLITDSQGRARLEVPLADSITSWRLTASANTRGGLLGSAGTDLLVFQPFFADIDFPQALTQNDEVEVPVAVYNYLKEAQQVNLQVEQEPWFELTGSPRAMLSLAPGEVGAAHFRVKARGLGRRRLTVYAWGTDEAARDAVRREVEIVPDGKMVEVVMNAPLGAPISASMVLPANSIPGSTKIYAKVTTGVVAQVLDGVEGMLRAPHGCFEQTSSCTYPSVLALQYLRRAKKSSPAVEAKADEYINAGYQRLLTYEVPGGGFSLWGKVPASVVLSAYGMLEFTDMSAVHDIDTRIIDRTKQWLLSQQRPDGSWTMPQTWTETWYGIDGDFIVTAYVAECLAEAGDHSRELGRACTWLRDHMDSAKDSYSKAMALGSLAIVDPQGSETQTLLKDLLSRKLTTVEGKTAWWAADGSTASSAHGHTAEVETTALAAMAMMRSRYSIDSTNGALAWLASRKNAGGGWNSTSATVLALRAILQGGTAPAKAAPSTVVMTLNGVERRIAIAEDQADILQYATFSEGDKEAGRPGANDLTVSVEGTTSSEIQVVGRTWVPWKEVPKETKKPFAIQVAYDRRRLSAAEFVTAQVNMSCTADTAAASVCFELGIPPSFTPDEAEFQKLLADRKIEKFEMGAGHVTLYCGTFKPGETMAFTYTLRPKYPVKVKCPKSTVYEYYSPDRRDETEGAEIEVTN